MRTTHFYKFGPFCLDLAGRLLLRNGDVVPLAPKVLDTLVVLLENSGRVVGKDELMKALWPDTFVEEGNLTQNISVLRKTLSEAGGGPSYIETIPKRGYRFTGPVSDETDASPGESGASLVPEEPRTQERPQRRRRTLLWALALCALSVAVVAGFLLTRRAANFPPATFTPVPLTSYPGEELHPSFSPDGNQVAFTWNGPSQDNYDIYVKLIGSEKALRLTTHPAVDYGPAWSPDGRFIAFARTLSPTKAGIFLIPAIGGPERKLAEEPTEIDYWGLWGPSLAWSPDGKWLVVGKWVAKSERNSSQGGAGLFLLSIETGQRRQLTSPPAGSADGGPAFPPDGRMLAFSRSRTYGISNLYLLALSPDLTPRGEPRRLTFWNEWTASPAWTPDGLEVIFSSGQWFGGACRLWRMAANGTGTPRRLSFAGDHSEFPAISRQGRLAYAEAHVSSNIWRAQLLGPGRKAGPPERLIASTHVEFLPQFSPDGRRIAFSSNRSGAMEVWVCGADGSNPMQLTSMGGPATGGARWSPDGERIVFDSNREGQAELYLINANGGAPQRLTTNPADDAQASWSRDGRWIYFVSNRSGRWQVWKMPAAGGEAVQVSHNGGFVAFESADGKFVYFSRLGPEQGGISSLARIPVRGGEEAQVLEAVMSYSFAVAKEGIYFSPGPEAEGRYWVRFFSFATGKTTPVLLLPASAGLGGGLAVSPDGRTLLYAQCDSHGSDLMLVENFR